MSSLKAELGNGIRRGKEYLEGAKPEYQSPHQPETRGFEFGTDNEKQQYHANF